MEIRFLGPIQRPPAETVAEVADRFERGTVRELLQRLGYPPNQVHFLSVIRNDLRLSPDQEVAAEDRITVMLTVGGG
jgi:sulfur carrier protein ThiS